MGPPPPILGHPLFIFGVMALVFLPLERLRPAWAGHKLPRPRWLADLAFFFTAAGLLWLEVNWWVRVLPVWLKPLSLAAVQGAVASLPGWSTAPLAFLIATFFDYWGHRLLHTPLFWPLHAVHHSPPQVDWLSGVRVHPLELFFLRTAQIVPLVWLGFPPHVYTVVPFGWFLFGCFTHSNLKLPWGPLKWLVVTPQYHHWHHSTDLALRDTNFGGFIPLWDWAFGTLTPPVGTPEVTGVTVPVPDGYLRSIAFALFPGRAYRHALALNWRQKKGEAPAPGLPALQQSEQPGVAELKNSKGDC